MAFGRPTRYWQLDSQKVHSNGANNKKDVWDRSVYDASEEYKKRMVQKRLLAKILMY
jgi:hypothetical protein